ncbi:anthranilate synthase component I [Dehalococcoides mccartyi]|jgi:anthranilate synthase component 1|uniref:Anthranilate synthase component 1 n=1 Tax=Dehalococcoides mccartyi TaxID=61435 RepID=A0A328EKB2_9CHLR|nr:MULTISPECIES: anthranilate synthase component I [Dehalococcoides]AQU06440.1 anthranilate synthase component I [Dehalococcoides mccartyi]AQU07882.1 anthranilate synthase component I [Dehalococcoides mccartyi]AQW62911.1 anthranilate synthase component I [Dehalococcoides mccartyi]AQY73699.1 anthranilate synthase component I [Dehalococcoides mccartyi]RAL69052.1 Anthranilate synthase, aminase component [Dehalococcoides mccartyi]
MYYPSLAEVKKLAAQGNLIPISCEIMADLETPVSAFLKIKDSQNAFLLESVEGGERVARYSFIGTNPHKVLTAYQTDTVPPLTQVENELNKYRVVPVGDLPRFCGGAVGFLGYEAVTRFEELPSPSADPLNLPEAVFMLVDTMLVFDHISHSIKVLSYVHTEQDIETSYNQAIRNIENLVNRLRKPLPETAPKSTAASIPEMKSNFKQADFEGKVSKIRDYLNSGEAIQVVLSQRLSRPTSAHPFDIYRALRSVNPSPYMYYLDFGDFQIVGASPEVLVRVEDGEVMTRPLAGTRKRGKTQKEDASLEQELRHDEKECAEHTMLVDLGRNDIGRISQPGTVRITDVMDVERYSHVMHLVSHIQGKLKPNITPFEALQSCFPAGTVSGAPKIRAMEIIAEMETEKRGIYAGAVGYFSYSGNMDMAIAIRTMVVKGGIAHVQAGCGIVSDSVPEHEYQETLNKAQALLKALDRAENQASEKPHVITN